MIFWNEASLRVFASAIFAEIKFDILLVSLSAGVILLIFVIFEIDVDNQK